MMPCDQAIAVVARTAQRIAPAIKTYFLRWGMSGGNALPDKARALLFGFVDRGALLDRLGALLDTMQSAFQGA